MSAGPVLGSYRAVGERFRRWPAATRHGSVLLIFTLVLSAPAAAASFAVHESPSQGTVESGVGVIRGWACDADEIEILIDGHDRMLVPYGGARGDTEPVCGDTDNGYATAVNWNRYDDGPHDLEAFVDGKRIASVTFHVARFSDVFLRDLDRSMELLDFPAAGDRMQLAWSEPHQNFTVESFRPTEPTAAFYEVDLRLDLADNTGRAIYKLVAKLPEEIRLEAGGIEIHAVRADGTSTAYHRSGGDLIVPLDPTAAPEALEIDFSFDPAPNFTGVFPGGASTYTWPYFCENVFPCISAPASGARYRLHLDGVPEGATAVYPGLLFQPVPAYQIAWAIGDYRYEQLGVTEAGTRVGSWTLPGPTPAAVLEKLFEAFGYLEGKLGAYPMGRDAAVVQVAWPVARGGIEHHPYWHVDTRAFGDATTHFHEAAHGWFGGSVRIACWEDLVLSEGLASYLAAAATGAVYGETAEAEVWADYDARLRSALASRDHIARPPGCGTVDVLEDLFTPVPYFKGALFFRAIEATIGRPSLLSALRAFHASHRGRAASLEDLLLVLARETGHDPGPEADAWLRSTGHPDD